jgi:putative colanic acid biosynthesis glycosyltransferase
MINNPLITVVTVVYSGENCLEQTIISVIGQNYKNIEYVVIDGGSVDKTIDVIKKYEKSIYYWVSEKDGGIYDAMNKGMYVANGDFVIFMNAGDKFHKSDSLKTIVEKIDCIDKVYFGRAKVSSADSHWLHPGNEVTIDSIDTWLEKEEPNHQAMFFPKIFYKNENYDLNYKIFGDADYKHRAKKFSGLHFIDTIVCEFDFGGISSSFDNYKYVKTMMLEAWKIGNKRGTLFLAIKRISIYNIKYILQKFLGEVMFFKIIKNNRK